MITLLVAPAELAAAEVVVAGDAYRHLFRARRLAAGARLRLTDGEGRARWAEVGRVGNAGATLLVGAAAPAHESALRLELLVATLRPERASWLVEKATELGVAAVRFFHCERAPRELGAAALARLRRVAAAALEQCHGSRLPALSGAHAWEEVPGLGAAERWVLDTAAAAGWGGWPAGGGVNAPASLLVGPEGGWSAAEQEALAAAGWLPVGLGERTLRSETAAIAGAALLLLPRPPIRI
jgi:16S rRNA (uracil1498-N3)-methyltransferase